MTSRILSRLFYERPAPQVAPELIGCVLVRVMDGVRLSGIICETEAYQGQTDLACHARVGVTPRTKVMFGEAGHAYIYFTYGKHWLLNITTDVVGSPSAVLIRALYPVEGVGAMTALRPMLSGGPNWLNGPAKLTQALGLDGRMNTVDMCSRDAGVWVEQGVVVPADVTRVTPRVGLGGTPEPWHSIPWRWLVNYQEMDAIVKKTHLI